MDFFDPHRECGNNNSRCPLLHSNCKNSFWFQHVFARNSNTANLFVPCYFWNIYPVAPKNSKTASEIYKGSIYFKGAWILHTLRYFLGAETFKIFLRRMIYPDPGMEQITDGAQVRFVTTNDFLYLAESISGKDLDWLFEIYLRQPDLPELVSTIDSDILKIHWEVPNGLSFPMPVEVEFGDKIQRVEVPAGGAVIKFENGVKPEIDPHNWILYREQYPEVVSIESSLSIKSSTCI